MYQTINENNTFELVEKKSRFIANLMYVESKLDAETKIKELKKKYHDARHNCFAFRVLEDDSVYEKSSDDGEPSGTAGAPMLNILQKNNLCNVLVVVTRYFGGILLGTGGLVRAYSESLQKVIESSNIIEKQIGFELKVTIEYNNFEIFKYYCKNNDINIVNTEYLENIVCKIELEDEKKEKLMKDYDTKKIYLKNLEVISKKYIEKSK